MPNSCPQNTTEPGRLIGKVVVAGQDSPYLRILALRLRQADLDVALIVEDRPKKKARILHPLLRICESLYWRLRGRAGVVKPRLHDEYWQQRLPKTGFETTHYVKSLNSTEAGNLIGSLRPELMLTYGPRMLKEKTYSIPRLGTFNLHGGKLPEFRGSLAEFWTIKRGRYEDVGVSLHRMTSELDAGDVIFFLPVPAKSVDDEYDARLRWQRKLLWVVSDWVRNILAGNCTPVAQDERSARTYSVPLFINRLRVDMRRMLARLEARPLPVEEEICLPPGKKAAFAISNDADETSTERFKYVHEVVRNRLGMKDFSDSMFFFQAENTAKNSGQISLFEGASADGRPGNGYSLLRETLREGHVETMHGWGDFSQKGGFSRAHAQAATQWLSSEGLRLQVWVNHGDRHNEQSLGPETNLSKGDVPEAKDVYHLDLVRRCGIRYFWVGHLNPATCLGGNRFALSEALTPISLDKPARLRFAALVLAWLYAMTGKRIFLKAVHRLGWQYMPDNRIVIPYEFRDGTRGWIFQRCGRWERSDWRAFELLISEKSIARIVREGGAMIVYTHMGKGQPTEKALQLLEKVAGSKEVWVASVHQLLDAALSVVSPDAPIVRAGTQ